IKSVMGFGIYLLLLKDVSLFLILVTVCTTICGYLFTNYIGGWDYRHREEKSELLKKFYYAVGKGEDRVFAKDVRMFGMEAWIRELMEKYQHLLWAFSGKGQRKYFLADTADILLAFLRNGIAYGYLLSLAFGGGISVSRFLLLFTAIGGFTEWISRILTHVTVLHRQSLELSTLREFLDQEEIFRMEGGIMPQVREGMEYTIELRDVTFGYPGIEKPVFEHFNLTIPAGEKLAVVGLNGAGKTTLVKLICGFYDPDEGEIRLNGVNVKEFNRRAYYRLFAGVFQNFSILPGSIWLNVSQKAHGVDREKALSCIEKAGLLEKIESLPKGMDSLLDKTVFHDAEEMSGGEMQRLMLARLLYRNSPVIVLDEPTAALDAIAENDVYQRYQELTKGHTSVYISHRLASTRFCDRIILIQNGKIIEEGSHEELMELGESYAKLFEIQSKYYREGEMEDEERKEAFG
ncbi:MAG: ABC transporter ATP-binding protein/permease, partial [Lachnospiraceae bacterium]|nr:ABC transporter ATP-binding protein/permease [Lachnospiraceae bacterium]